MDKKTPTVSIVLLNWNGLEDTLECLASLRTLTYPSVEIIVVDNASRDEQAEAIEKAYPEITVLKQSENLGFCGGCNVGIEYTLRNGVDYVMLLNNDTLVTTDVIEKLVQGIDGLDNVGAVSPIIIEYPDRNKVSYSDARWESKTAQFSLTGKDDNYKDLAAKNPYTTDFTCGCCLFAPAEVFQKEGLLDERYFAFYDEAAWCAQIRKNGYKSYVVPSAFIYHKGTRSTPSLVSTYLMARNRLLWMAENLPLRERLKSTPYLLKELIWHSLNLIGLTRGIYTKQHSRAFIQGWKDYLYKKFYKWDEKNERILFQ